MTMSTTFGASIATVSAQNVAVAIGGAIAILAVAVGVGIYVALLRARPRALVTEDGRRFSERGGAAGPPVRTPKLVAYGDTHVGGRENNEDRFLIQDGVSFVVADGMGGHSGGEVASTALVEVFEKLDPRLPEWFAAGMNLTNARIRGIVAEDSRLRGCGTTVVAARCVAEEIEVSWVGDSHFFRLRNGVLERLTEEHSIAVALWRAGKISEEDVKTHPMRNVLHKSVQGTEKVSDWDTVRFLHKVGDVYLICSDGVLDYSDLNRVKEILSDKRIANKAQALVAMAVADSTKDNATAIVVEVTT